MRYNRGAMRSSSIPSITSLSRANQLFQRNVKRSTRKFAANKQKKILI